MGAVIFPLREFYDSTSELVGIKSGILLNRFQVSSILLEKFNDEFLKSDNLNRYVRIRSEEIENMLLAIRQKIGNLPTILPSIDDYQYLREYVLKTGDFRLASSASVVGLRYLHDNNDITNTELAKLISAEYNLKDDRLSLAIANISIEQNDLSCIFPESKSWDGATELSALFDCEIQSNSDYLEQKFIDYLAVNGDEIEHIHWRNFERFCAEYFKKQGYIVNLGPGTNDGGVDIRVYKEGGRAPEIMIQCKRHKKENKVKIETVKSFYTDVKFENAKTGLIATTGYIADGGKKVCETRGYNIKFAENDNIKKWAREMWTFK